MVVKIGSIKLSGRWVKKRINGRMVEVLVPPKKPSVTWEDLVEAFKYVKPED